MECQGRRSTGDYQIVMVHFRKAKDRCYFSLKEEILMVLVNPCIGGLELHCRSQLIHGFTCLDPFHGNSYLIMDDIR